MTPQATGLLLLCRPGFERECAAEVQILDKQAGLGGQAEILHGSGCVHHVFAQAEDWTRILEAFPFSSLIFARQRSAWVKRLSGLPPEDRVSPLVETIVGLGMKFGHIEAETADTNEAKTLSGFLKRFVPHIERALTARKILGGKAANLPTLHLLFKDSSQVDIGLSHPQDASPWPMGIARLRIPRNAPSRSTLKLAEAFAALMTEEERASGLKAGLWAVDLGASPGGWSFQFAERGLNVFAVDNGPLAPSLLKTDMVEHVRADGFTWRPPRKHVEWLVCDMVEQPSRIAQLVADWVASGRAKRSIFNLKLPMKKRLEEIARCCQIIDTRFKQHADPYVLRIRQLYHDREEVTAYLAKAEPIAITPLQPRRR